MGSFLPYLKSRVRMMAASLASLLGSILLVWMIMGNGAVPVSCAHAGNGDGERLTAKASLIRYWDLKIPNSQKPSFLADKASPLSATDSATFRRHAEQQALQSHLRPFCESANLFCFPQPSWQLQENCYYPSHHHHQQQQLEAEGKNIISPLRFKPYTDPPEAEGKNIISPLKFKPYTDPPEYETEQPETYPKKKWVPEPGKFFREKELKPGTVVPMPDIRDLMPQRSFLPRAISRNLPFSSSELEELQKVFRVSTGSGMEKAIRKTLLECEMEPSKGETKRCVTSMEDMIDFVVSVLGKHVELKATKSTSGWGKDVEIGSVYGIEGGKITTAVSCHQSMFPYLVYYCHAVPNVRVYEAALLDAMTKKPINQAMAMCHLDTSVWKESRVAFNMALGAEPGEVELCHWVFENDIIWVHAG